MHLNGSMLCRQATGRREFEYGISLNAEDGQLKIDAPETALTDEFLESAKQHKPGILEALN